MLAPPRRALAFAACALLATTTHCDSTDDTTSDLGATRDGPMMTTGDGAIMPTGDGAIGMMSDAALPSGDGAVTASPICDWPLQPASTSGATVVGNGTAASCTQAALATALAGGGAITFDCGGAATIAVTQELTVPTDRDTVIDGGGVITLDGGDATRILHFKSGDYRGMYGGPQHVLTVQHLAFAHAHASGTMISVPSGAPAACSRGYNTDGGGGAIFVESGILHVLDCSFVGNHAATPGPDVAGGGVYVTGSTDVTIVGSRFDGNGASNGGAIGCLNSDLTLVDDVITNSMATGSGANSVDTSQCPGSINGGQVGSGGNGGAVSIDGGSDGTVTICGVTFAGNMAGALGGAMFRTPDGATQTTQIDRSTFDGNSAPVSGGGAMYMHNSVLQVSASTFSNNSATGAGAIQADSTQLVFENVTLTHNVATSGCGGAFSIFNFDSSGTIQPAGTLTNCTVAGNEAHGTNYSAFGAASFGSPFAWNNCLIVDNSDDSGNGKQSCANEGTGQGTLQWPQQVSTGNDPPCAPSVSFTDPMLGVLADNGGPTKTMLPAASPSVLQIGMSCPATDQTGRTRKMPCTVGAVELP